LPGTVGEEYLMTRGHLHEPVEAAEVYHCISGNGVLMLESISGQLTTVEMAPNRVIYIPGGLIHRSVNVGTTPLITLFLYRANVGQDYGVVEQAHGLSKLLVRDDAGWKLVTNSNYRARRVAQ
jgi:glucose-6-phosphate isomerase